MEPALQYMVEQACARLVRIEDKLGDTMVRIDRLEQAAKRNVYFTYALICGVVGGGGIAAKDWIAVLF